MGTYPRSELTEQIYEVRKVQNGDTRKYDFHANRRMGNIYRFQGCLLSYPGKPTVQEIPAFSHPGSILPVQGSTTAPVEFTMVVKQIKLMLQNKGIRIHQNLEIALPELARSYVSGTRLDSKHGEIRTGIQGHFWFHWLSV